MRLSDVAVLSRRPSSDWAVFLLVALYVLVMMPFCPELASSDQLTAVVINAAPLLVLTLGQVFVLVVGGIDLSMSGMISWISVIGAMLFTGRWLTFDSSVMAVVFGICSMLTLGILLGALHGWAVAGLRMPAFLVTMASMMVLGGAAVWVTGGERIGGLPLVFLDTLQSNWWGVPVSVGLAGGLALATHLIFCHMILGQHLIAVGLNPQAAQIAGISLMGITIFAFAASGFCSAIAALMVSARMETASPVYPREVMLDAIGAAVIGGTSLSGGRVSVIGAVGGSIFIALMSNSLTLLNLDYWHVLMAKGGVILFAALADGWRRRWTISEVSR